MLYLTYCIACSISMILLFGCLVLSTLGGVSPSLAYSFLTLLYILTLISVAWSYHTVTSQLPISVNTKGYIYLCVCVLFLVFTITRKLIRKDNETIVSSSLHILFWIIWRGIAKFFVVRGTLVCKDIFSIRYN